MDDICPHCGHGSLEEHPRFCSACGGRMDSSCTPAGSGSEIRPENEKNPQIAVFCSSLIPGLGQVYNGETLKGFVFLFGTLLGLFLILIPGLVVWIYSMYDAHITAGKMNEGKLKFRPMQPAYMVLFVVAAVFLMIVVVVAITLIVISTMLTQLSPLGNADSLQMLKMSHLFP
jgi:TM2 domain-containing membrane protein YozV